MRVAAETAKQEADLFVHHRVIGDGVFERLHLAGGRKLTVKKQIANFEKGRFFGQLLNGITAIQQDAGIAIDEGDGALARRGRGKSGVVGENIGVVIKSADVHRIRTLGRLIGRQFDALIAVGERCRSVGPGAARSGIHPLTPGIGTRGPVLRGGKTAILVPG